MSQENEEPTEVLGFLEEMTMNDIKKSISTAGTGKETETHKILDRYGKEGLEEFLMGSKLDSQPGLLDPSVAKKYYIRSVEKGHALGQLNMALIYVQGTHETEKDEKKAVKLMKLSANQGCASALYNKAKWLLDGTMGEEKNPKKAYKLLEKAKKDPLMYVMGDGYNILFLLSKMRLDGNGCKKNPEKAQEFLYAAEKLQPGNIPKEVFDMYQLMVAMSPISNQRESDLRWRRLKVAYDYMGKQTLGDWENLHAYYGMPFSISPSSKGDGDLVMTWQEMREWKMKVGCQDQLPETYPAMDDPLPPLECDNRTCDVDETQLEGSMKKCSECEAPYCSEKCQRADWKNHKPVCEAISLQINGDSTITDSEREYIKGTDLASIKEMGLTHVLAELDARKKEARKCNHKELGTPCNKTCLVDKVAETRKNQQKFAMVGGKQLSSADKEAASRLGFKIPDELQ